MGHVLFTYLLMNNIIIILIILFPYLDSPMPLTVLGWWGLFSLLEILLGVCNQNRTTWLDITQLTILYSWCWRCSHKIKSKHSTKVHNALVLLHTSYNMSDIGQISAYICKLLSFHLESPKAHFTLCNTKEVQKSQDISFWETIFKTCFLSQETHIFILGISEQKYPREDFFLRNLLTRHWKK